MSGLQLTNQAFCKCVIRAKHHLFKLTFYVLDTSDNEQ